MAEPKEITITVDDQTTQVAEGTTGNDLFAEEKTTVVMKVDGVLQDLFRVIPAGATVERVDITDQEGLEVLRHSTAHVLAQAVQELHPEAKLGIGPFIEDGFYYDFDVDEPFTPDDLKEIQKRMMRIVKAGQTFNRRAVDEAQAVKSSPMSRINYSCSTVNMTKKPPPKGLPWKSVPARSLFTTTLIAKVTSSGTTSAADRTSHQPNSSPTVSH